MQEFRWRVFLFALILVTGNALAFAQPAPESRHAPIDIAYTGRFLGYFRETKNESGNPIPKNSPRCPLIDRSEAATQFITLRDTAANGNLILVGAGDNFAPQLEARIFEPLPPGGAAATGPNKEFF